MKRFLMSVAAFGVCATAAAIAQPKLEIVGGTTYNWGNISPKTSPLETAIKIVNLGNEELHVTGVKPGCGCTTAPIDKDKIKPGDTATVKVSLNVGASSGDLTKVITITSNDPKASNIIYSLKANVIRAVQVLPSQYFVFTGATLGNKSEAKVQIKNNSDAAITLSDYETTNGLKINWNGNKSIKPGEQAELTASLIPDKTGYFNGTVRMKTTNPDFPSIEIMAYGNVENPNAPAARTNEPPSTSVNSGTFAPAPQMATPPAQETSKKSKSKKP